MLLFVGGYIRGIVRGYRGIVRGILRVVRTRLAGIFEIMHAFCLSTSCKNIERIGFIDRHFVHCLSTHAHVDPYDDNRKHKRWEHHAHFNVPFPFQNMNSLDYGFRTPWISIGRLLSLHPVGRPFHMWRFLITHRIWGRQGVG